jgi:hypothetical protein
MKLGPIHMPWRSTPAKAKQVLDVCVPWLCTPGSNIGCISSGPDQIATWFEVAPRVLPVQMPDRFEGDHRFAFCDTHLAKERAGLVAPVGLSRLTGAIFITRSTTFSALTRVLGPR